MPKKLAFYLLTFAVSFVALAQTKPILPYKNPKLSVEERVKDLISRMTIEEKAGQLNQLNGGEFTGPAKNDPGQMAKMKQVKEGKVGSMLNVTGVVETSAIQKIAMEESRLGIPMLFALDVIHGYSTIFPIPLAEACSWDLPAIEKNSSIAAKEAAAAGIHWTFAPMCDIGNDIRWGRVMEGAGEDPYYGGLVAASRVRGFQGKLDDDAHLLACIKHFAGYGAVESGREYNLTDFSRPALWNKYLPPYKAAVDAGAATLMNGFNVLDGVPVSGSSFLINDILKARWGFKGLLVSDWGSFSEMISWGHAEDDKDAAMKALNAGSMMDMQSQTVIRFLPELVKEGKVSMQAVDEAVMRTLEIKFRLGLFDQPYKFSNPEREKKMLFTQENRSIARDAARKSIVLLKNEKQTLPILPTVKKLALIGAFADSKDDMFDFWIAKGESKNAVSVLEGIKAGFEPNAVVSFSKGYNIDGTTSEILIKEAVEKASLAEVILVNIGISGKMAGEDRALANPAIPEAQIQLLKALQKTGKPIVAIVTSGRPLILTEVQPLVSSIVQCWILGTETGSAIADVLSGQFNPSGKTVMTFPYAVGQIPVYYNHFKTGRPLPSEPDGDMSWKSRYRDIPNEPLYPFGYGLSYTNFTYSDFKLSSSSGSKGGTLIASVNITNSGNFDGEEVVQLYIRDLAASIIRPVKELKGFQKIKLKKGEKSTVQFTLTDNEFSFFNADGMTKLEPGRFHIFVGTDSKNTQKLDFDLK